MRATADPTPTVALPAAVSKRAANHRRALYARRLLVLHNRHDWATIARDKALDRLDRVHAEMAALDAEYPDVTDIGYPCCPEAER